MTASLIPLLAARFMMSSAARLNPITGLGAVPHTMTAPMLRPGPIVRTQVNFPKLQMMMDPAYKGPELPLLIPSLVLRRLGARNVVMNASVRERPVLQRGGGSPPPPPPPPPRPGRPGGSGSGDDCEYLKRLSESDVAGLVNGWIGNTKVLRLAGQFVLEGLAETYTKSLEKLEGLLSFSQNTDNLIVKDRTLLMGMYSADGEKVLALAAGSLVKIPTGWAFVVKYMSVNPAQLRAEKSFADLQMRKGLQLLAEEVDMELKMLDESVDPAVMNAAGLERSVLKRRRGGGTPPPPPPDDRQPDSDGVKNDDAFLHRVSGSDVMGLLDEWIGHTKVLRMGAGQFGNNALDAMYTKTLEELEGLRSFTPDSEKSDVKEGQQMILALYSADRKTVVALAAGSLVNTRLVIKYISASPAELCAESSVAEWQLRKGLTLLAEEIGVELKLAAALERPVLKRGGGSPPSSPDDGQLGQSQLAAGSWELGSESEVVGVGADSAFLLRVSGSEVLGVLDGWIGRTGVLRMTGQFGNNVLAEKYTKSLEELEGLRSFSPNVQKNNVKDGQKMLLGMYSADGMNALAFAAGSLVKHQTTAAPGWTLVIKYISVDPAELCALVIKDISVDPVELCAESSVAELQMRAGLRRLAEEAGMDLEIMDEPSEHGGWIMDLDQ